MAWQKQIRAIKFIVYLMENGGNTREQTQVFINLFRTMQPLEALHKSRGLFLVRVISGPQVPRRLVQHNSI